MAEKIGPGFCRTTYCNALSFLWTVVCAPPFPHRGAALFNGCWQAHHRSERSGAAALAGLLGQDVSHFWWSLILSGSASILIVISSKD
jgi:hypothetical protein